jgi:hypothetical protein
MHLDYFFQVEKNYTEDNHWPGTFECLFFSGIITDVGGIDVLCYPGSSHTTRFVENVRLTYWLARWNLAQFSGWPMTF